MKRPTFLEGVAVALVASVAGTVLHTVLAPLFAGDWVLRLLIAGIGFGYIVYLLGRSPERVGRITTCSAWLVAAVATWWLQPSLALYVLVHLGLVWLIRSLYFYSSVLSSLADLGLNGLGLAAAAWAMLQTHSLFLGIWCLFLVQALFVAIPSDMRRKATAGPHGEDRFQHAHRVAESALRKLASIR